LRLSRSEAEEIAREVNFEKMGGLVPVVVQDQSTDTVLMQAFMNREALMLTLEKGLMHYWSRTRRKIWLKGEQSGHYSLVENAILDCDKDAILFKVNQVGPCCHTGEYSCFHNPVSPIKEKGVDTRVMEKAFEIIKHKLTAKTEFSLSSEEFAEKLSEEVNRIIRSFRERNIDGLIDDIVKHMLSILLVLAEAEIPLTRIYEKLESLNRTGIDL